MAEVLEKEFWAHLTKFLDAIKEDYGYGISCNELRGSARAGPISSS
jgi:hypothetical protein